MCGVDIDPYQKVGVDFLCTAKKAILADDPGIGKSAQAIRAANAVGAKRVLIVAKKSLIFNWKQQIELWSIQECVFDITNYEQVVAHPEKYFTVAYDALIVDEAHMVKNRRSDRSKAIAKLAKKIPYVWLLTGSPILNRPDELWFLLHTISPKEYSSYWRFVGTYCATEPNRWSGGTKVIGLKAGVADALAKELSPVMLRRTRDIITLPAITHETVYVTLEGAQRKMYKTMEKDFIMFVQDQLTHASSVVAQLVRLQQIICSPALFEENAPSAKTNAVLDLVANNAPNHKMILFTTFAGYAKHLHSLLGAYGAVLITGSSSVKERENAVQSLSGNPACRILVGTLGAMGEGLNIQAADVVIFANKPWVPAIIEQATHRAYRRGQEKPVHVINLQAKGTVDDHIEAVLNSKKAVVGEFDVIMSMMRNTKKG